MFTAKSALSVDVVTMFEGSRLTRVCSSFLQQNWCTFAYNVADQSVVLNGMQHLETLQEHARNDSVKCEITRRTMVLSVGGGRYVRGVGEGAVMGVGSRACHLRFQLARLSVMSYRRATDSVNTCTATVFGSEMSVALLGLLSRSRLHAYCVDVHVDDMKVHVRGFRTLFVAIKFKAPTTACYNLTISK